MSETKLQTEARTTFGKGAARQVRRAGRIPAVMYGHGTDPVHITLPGHATMLALKVQNALLTLDIDGSDQLALVKDVQRDVVRGDIEHVDLVVIRRGEKVTVDVRIHIEGDSAPDTLVNLEAQTIELEALATNIPEQVTVDVQGLRAGTQIHAVDLVLPDGATLSADGDLLIVNITQAQSIEALEAELAESEAEAGIEHEVHTPVEGEAGAPAAGAADADADAAGDNAEA
jgi:large subunit ribosomal protein L25